ncbi:MAG: hypothetical protein KDB52_00665 [Solirubrobacterales bacterium]|nr:hypothetical protein [Solirubrobacterales bacterium]
MFKFQRTYERSIVTMSDRRQYLIVGAVLDVADELDAAYEADVGVVKLRTADLRIVTLPTDEISTVVGVSPEDVGVLPTK